jgi:hypothetical protein
MSSEVLNSLVALSSSGVFVAVCHGKADEADSYLLGALIWAIPAFVIAMAFAALEIGVFYPAIRLVAAAVAASP